MYIYSAFAVALLLVLAACGGGGSGGNGDNNLSGGGSSSSGSSGGSSSSGGVVAGNCPQCVTNNVTATNIPNLVTQLQNSYPGSISTSNATLLSQYEYTELAAYPSDTNAVSLFNGTWNQYFDDDYNNYPGECYVLVTAVTKNGYCSALGAPTTAIATLVFSNMKQTAENGGDFSDTDLTNGLTAQGQFKLYIGFLPGTDGPSTTASGNVEQAPFALVIVSDIFQNGSYYYSSLQQFVGSVGLSTNLSTPVIPCAAFNGGGDQPAVEVTYTQTMINPGSTGYPAGTVLIKNAAVLAPASAGSVSEAPSNCS